MAEISATYGSEQIARHGRGETRRISRLSVLLRGWRREWNRHLVAIRMRNELDGRLLEDIGVDRRRVRARYDWFAALMQQW